MGTEQKQAAFRALCGGKLKQHKAASCGSRGPSKPLTDKAIDTLFTYDTGFSQPLLGTLWE